MHCPANEIGHHREDSTKSMPPNANVDEAAFPKGTVLQALNFKCIREGADSWESTTMCCMPRWSDGEKLAILGTVNFKMHRKAKIPK